MTDPEADGLADIALRELQDLSLFRLPPGFRGRPGPVVLLWQIVQATLFAWSPQPFYGWRRLLLRAFGARIGRKVIVRPTARVTYPWKLEIGDWAWIGDHAELYCLGPMRIGANAVVSQRSFLCGGAHDHLQRDFPIFAKPIEIGESAWLASDVFVAPGVTIGAGAVVGARSTVLADLPAGMICWGSPAKPIKPRRPRA
jgi:putative colanic acid biosynthesis acetyltransferase WcaF